MARLFHVSVPESEKDLLQWISEREQDRTFSATIIFQDAVKERKKEWDTMHTENPKLLKDRIESLKGTLTNLTSGLNEFHDSKNLGDDWVKFFSNFEPKKEKKIEIEKEVKQ